jgi:hypothetical protein
MHTFLVLENCGGGEKYVLGSWIRVMARLKGCLESKGDRTNEIIHLRALHFYKIYFLYVYCALSLSNIKQYRKRPLHIT